MEEIINKILNGKYKEANDALYEELSSIVERKLAEKKKMIAVDKPVESPFKSDAQLYGVKAKRKPLKGVSKVLKKLKEATVEKDGLVHLSTGEEVLPSVYRQRRWLAEDEEKSEDKDEKIKAALEKAKMLIQPELDTTAPRVNRMKMSVPKGVRPADRLSCPDLGPKEDEWMSGKELKKESEQVNEGIKDKIVQKVNDLMNLRSDRRDQETIRQMDEKRRKKKVVSKYGVKGDKAKMDRRLKVNKYPISKGKSVPLVNEE